MPSLTSDTLTISWLTDYNSAISYVEFLCQPVFGTQSSVIWGDDGTAIPVDSIQSVSIGQPSASGTVVTLWYY